jgi:hypothetical protein
MIDFEPNETGGGALLIGFVLLTGALYRTPARGLEAATATPQSALYVLLLPIVGLLTGVYAYAEGPYSAIAVFVSGVTSACSRSR